MPQRDELLIDEMIDAAQQAVDLVTGRSVDDLRGNRQLRDALLWNFTVLGEAANQLSSATKELHPDIQWSRPTQLRNRIVHGYWSIDINILHHTATHQLPDYIVQLRAIRPTST